MDHRVFSSSSVLPWGPRSIPSAGCNAVLPEHVLPDWRRALEQHVRAHARFWERDDVADGGRIAEDGHQTVEAWNAERFRVSVCMDYDEEEEGGQAQSGMNEKRERKAGKRKSGMGSALGGG